jgi:hypothetical protein
MIGYSDNISDPTIKAPDRVVESDDPTFSDLLQNKLTGEHQLGKVKLEWALARTSIERQEKDLGLAYSNVKIVNNEPAYYYYAGRSSEVRFDPLSRHHYSNSERHKSYSLSASIPFKTGKLSTTVKTGAFGIFKRSRFDWEIAAVTNGQVMPENAGYVPISEMLNPDNIKDNGYFYSIAPGWNDYFEGKSQTHAGYLMFDNRLFDKLRIVWGLRGEYFKYDSVSSGINAPAYVTYKTLKDPKMQWLPSVNLTFSPISNLNIRGAFSKTTVRPELMENSRFWRYSPYMGGMYGSAGILSTTIKSYDLKAEWFPGAGEIVSAGVFHKYFRNPAELVLNSFYSTAVFYLKSSDWAEVDGLEFEVRKNFGFIANSRVLRNLTAYGNLTLTRSKVVSTYNAINPNGGADLQFPSRQSRPLYGQAPYLINAGLQYNGEHFGFNAMYNKTGYKTYLVSDDATRGEFEKPREQMDAQVSYRMLKRKLEIKLNAGNLFNALTVFYRNTASYKQNPDAIADGDASDSYLLKEGYSNDYDEGDMIQFAKRSGRTFSLSVSYNF